MDGGHAVAAWIGSDGVGFGKDGERDMARKASLVSRALATAACASLTLSPALAASLPNAATRGVLEAPRTWTPGSDTAADRGWGGDGWGGHRRHHHDDGVSAGDVFAGLLILGGIAAIASAASKSDKDKRAERDYRYNEPDSDSRDYDSGADSTWSGSSDRSSSRAMNDAVDTCVSAVEREGRVDEVYGAQRNGSGYQVSGRLSNGDEFACATGDDGRVSELTVDGRELAY